jgi:hypothetical protein
MEVLQVNTAKTNCIFLIQQPNERQNRNTKLLYKPSESVFKVQTIGKDNNNAKF